MDKETYIKRIAELNLIREKALEYNDKEKAKVNESYMKENFPFKNGDCIRIGNETGTIVNVQPQSDGKFFIEWVKNKKDGTPYKRISLMNSIEVEEIEKA